MGTANVTNTFADGQLGTAASVNTNFGDLVSFINESTVHTDGDNAMTGTLTLAADGAAPFDAVTFRQFDDGAPVAQVVAWSISPANQTTTADYAAWGSVVSLVAPSAGWRQLTAKVHFEALAVNLDVNGNETGSRIGAYKLQYSIDNGSSWVNFVVGPTAVTDVDNNFAVDYDLYANVARTHVLANITPTAPGLQFRVAVKSNLAGMYSFRQGTLTVDVVPS